MSSAETSTTSGKFSLTATIMIAMGLGIVVGILFDVLNSSFIDTHVVSGVFAMIGKMFVNPLKMLVAPLVFFSLLTGVTGREGKVDMEIFNNPEAGTITDILELPNGAPAPAE